MALQDDGKYHKQVFGVVLRMSNKYGSQPLLTAMVTEGDDPKNMTLDQMKEISRNEKKFVFVKQIGSKNIPRTFEEMCCEFEEVDRKAWDRFVETNVGRSLPERQVKIANSLISFHDFVAVAVNMGIFTEDLTKTIVGSTLVEFESLQDEGNVNLNNEGTQIVLREETRVVNNSLGDVVKEVGIDALDMNDVTIDDQGDKREDASLPDDTMENIMVDIEAGAVEKSVREDPVFKRMEAMVKKQKKTILDLNKQAGIQSKLIMKYEEEIREIKASSVKEVVGGLTPTIGRMVAEIKGSNFEVLNSFEKRFEALNKAQEDRMQAMVTEDRKKMQSLFDMQKGLMGGMGALISSHQTLSSSLKPATSTTSTEGFGSMSMGGSGSRLTPGPSPYGSPDFRKPPPSQGNLKPTQLFLSPNDVQLLEAQREAMMMNIRPQDAFYNNSTGGGNGGLGDVNNDRSKRIVSVSSAKEIGTMLANYRKGTEQGRKRARE